MGTNEVYKIIDRYEVVSFDIYDTLLRRDVLDPHDIFEIVEHEAVYLKGNLYKGFSNKRIKAEKEITDKAKRDVNIDEIYDAYKDMYDGDCNFLKKLEIEIEKEWTTSREDMVPIYEYVVEKKKKILLISDMYLPEKIITEILFKNGFTKYDKLYVSNEYGKSKHVGDLYTYVLKDKKISNKKILHIGDNFISDYIKAKIHGVAAYKINAHNKEIADILSSKCCRSLGTKLLYAFAMNRVHNKDIYTRVGYSVFGPILFGVSTWIRQYVEKNGIDIILFAARDGYLFNKAFKKSKGKCEARYLLVSRKSLILPFLSQRPQLAQFYKKYLSEFPSMFSIGYLFKKIELDSSALYEQFLSQYNYDDKQLFCKAEILSNEEFSLLYMRILDYFVGELNESFMAFYNYIKGQTLAKKKVAFFDIGWRGTIQSILESILNIEIYGLYIYVDKSVYGLRNAIGYLANSKKDVYKESSYNSLMELVFSAPHGSVKKYSIINSKNVVEFSPYEHSSTVEKASLDKMRSGAVQYYQDSLYSGLNHNTLINADDSFCFIREVGINPQIELVKLLKVFNFDDGKIYPLITSDNIIKLYLNPLCMVNGFLASRWKVGFLREVFPSFLPIGKIFIYLKNKYLLR